MFCQPKTYVMFLIGWFWFWLLLVSFLVGCKYKSSKTVVNSSLGQPRHLDLVVPKLRYGQPRAPIDL